MWTKIDVLKLPRYSVRQNGTMVKIVIPLWRSPLSVNDRLSRNRPLGDRSFRYLVINVSAIDLSIPYTVAKLFKILPVYLFFDSYIASRLACLLDLEVTRDSTRA